MSMEFGDDNEIRGGGGALMGLLAGSALNRDRDDGKTSTMMIVLAVIFFVIIFIIAIIALAMFNRDHKRDYGGGTDVAALLTPLIAAKSMDGNCHSNCFDKLEIMQKLEASEDRARQTQTQQEIGALGKEFAAMGFGLAGKIDNVEKEQLKTYATLENQVGALTMGMTQLLQKENNRDIINGVIQQLAMGAPCFAKC